MSIYGVFVSGYYGVTNGNGNGNGVWFNNDPINDYLKVADKPYPSKLGGMTFHSPTLSFLIKAIPISSPSK